ncbi:ATPase, F1/V1/A1 complex, alpha/beta subunit, Zinc knuckle CX2CX4HX4C [Artemisia annua]|uniref:ATPase, F1/V1/A1 complex, alpha/beta subunit, Zinc knuckle CX2CX4HX4C n=1 Tax=Artemisia annua TaxID=35608 RepID=A0A2U1L2V4_ARTAN|nr:ATPase, F1/V1/A1 complex, alpha/beta subunit, Zinc knuckle CX2CX4HX4C [Artemisia annua]
MGIQFLVKKKRNGSKNKNKKSNQEQEKGGSGNVNGEVSGEFENKGKENGFDGDLSGDSFPVLQSQVNKSKPTDNTPECDIAVNKPMIDINTGGESDVEVVSNAACSASGDICDNHESARVNDNTENTKMNEPNSGNTSTLAEILKSNKHDNSLHMVQTEVNENGVEIAVFDEEMIELGSAKWKMTVCGQFLGLGFARVLVELNAEKQFKDVIEIAYRSKVECTNMIKYVQVEYDWKLFRCSHCCVFGHEVDKCRMVPKDNVVDNQSKEHADCNDGFKEVQYRKGRNENNNSKNNRFEQNGLGGQYRNVGYNKKMSGPKNNYNKQEYKAKQNVEVASEIGVGKGKKICESKDKIDSSKDKSKSVDKSPSKNNSKASTSYQQTKVGVIGSNSFAPLEVLDNEEDVELSSDERMLVNQVLENKSDPTVNEWDSWNDMKKEYYRKKKDGTNGNKESTDEEEIVQDLSSTEECLLRNEVEGQSELRAKRIERVGENKNRKRVMCVLKTGRVYCELKELRELVRIKTDREYLCVSKTDRVFWRAKRIERIREQKTERELCCEKQTECISEQKELRDIVSIKTE